MSEELELTPGIRSKPIPIKAVANVAFTINHELGRNPAGWLVIDSNCSVNVWRIGVMDIETITLVTDQDAELTFVLL